MRLRPLDPTRDRAGLERLWRAALAPAWPVLPDVLEHVRDGVIAEADGDGDPIGAIVTDPAGSVVLLLVTPAHRRRGVGTALLDGALARLRAGGAGRVTLATGGAAYVWPGVPVDLPGAVAFFEARGWAWGHRVTDLTCDLRSYAAASGPPPAGVTVEVAGPAGRPAALAFERRWFPEWVPSFERRDAAILLARDAGGAVAGSLLFAGPGRCSIFWPMLGDDMAWIGCVGVAEPARGAGIAGAMVAHASALLRDAGAGTCLIDWARRSELYERCGYRRWRDYLTASRAI